MKSADLPRTRELVEATKGGGESHASGSSMDASFPPKKHRIYATGMAHDAIET
jgi:hypothetical protein